MFKVGDKVKVRKDLKFGVHYGGDSFEEDMKEYLGKIVTINQVRLDHYGKGKTQYYIEESSYGWTDEMLLPIKTRKKRKADVIKLVGKLKSSRKLHIYSLSQITVALEKTMNLRPSRAAVFKKLFLRELKKL